MSELAVRVEGLSKQYRLGVAVRGRLTEALTEGGRASIGRLFGRTAGRSRAQTIWALRDVSLEVEEGEVVGIIGRNGAGKSTLLKILSRITEPSAGFAELRGRVGSLLEVGSGFHPELTGRENLYLYGAILGMSRKEVKGKFEEIVAFAEIEQFIDTPVKRYSSGMYTRLAFAVAAHLEPEVLIVDEVLAVGDAAFQKKCLGKMGDVASEGRTVLFVSHNMAAVSSLCSRAYLLHRGELISSGPARQVVQEHLRTSLASSKIPLQERVDRGGDGSVRIVSLRAQDADGRGIISSSSPLRITLEYESVGPLRNAQFLATVYDRTYTGLFLLDSDTGGGVGELLPASGRIMCVTDQIALTPGECFLNVAIVRGGVLADHVEHALYFDVAGDDFYPMGKLPARDYVLTLRRHEWTALSL